MENISKSPEQIGLKTPESYRSYFEGEGDKKTYFWAESLRKQVESLPNWIDTKEKAQREMVDLPSNIIPKIFERLDPYVELIPVGHSQGHVYRDFISSMVNLRDPELQTVDDVEKVVGILAGTFHDIGNSVINRYEETKRFSGHAEVGAYLFGDLASDLIPPNILKLTQYAIAAHTHYTNKMSITREQEGKEETLTKRPYEDEVIDGNRIGVWLARGADRVDAQGVQMVARHTMVKSQPTEDYDHTTGFHKTREDELEDFKHQFTPILRTDEFRLSLSDEEKTRNVLEHIKMYRDSALERTAYSKYDSEYFTQTLIHPAAEEQMEFVEAVLTETEDLPIEEIDDSFEKFYSLCRIIEPGKDIDQVLETLKNKFNSLLISEKSHWANGFKILPNLYKRWFERIDEKLSEDLNDDFSLKTKEILESGNKLAIEKLQDFKP